MENTSEREPLREKLNSILRSKHHWVAWCDECGRPRKGIDASYLFGAKNILQLSDNIPSHWDGKVFECLLMETEIVKCPSCNGRRIKLTVLPDLQITSFNGSDMVSGNRRVTGKRIGGMLRNNSGDHHVNIEIEVDFFHFAEKSIGKVTAKIQNLPAGKEMPWVVESFPEDATICKIIDVRSQVAND